MSLRVVFMGTPEFSCAFLSALHQDPNFDVLGVATQPDRPAGRGRQLTAPAVKSLANELGLPVWQPENLRDPDFIQQMTDLKPDVFAVVAYSILPIELLAVPRLGSVNVHTSLLPKYRGAAPVQHALWQGESETGLTLFRLDEKMDHGPILAQWKTPITLQDDYTTVMERLAQAGPQFLTESLQSLASGTAQVLVQDHTAACGARKLRKEDGLIQWDQSALQVHNQIRALCSWPACFTYTNDKSLKITQSALSTFDLEATPGTVCSPDNKQLLVRCADGWLELVRVQPEGRKEVSGGEYWRGLQNKENIQFRAQL